MSCFFNTAINLPTIFGSIPTTEKRLFFIRKFLDQLQEMEPQRLDTS